jgi:hypothetical protein
MIRDVVPALALPVIVTSITLASVAWNRSGGREPIVLTERELRLRTASDDNSGLSVSIEHSRALSGEEQWLTADKLAALGFDTSVDPASPDAGAHYRRELGRLVYVALEHDGPAWRARAIDVERNIRQWSREEDVRKHVEASPRLVPVDADLDPAVLDGRYPNARTHLITRAVLRVYLSSEGNQRARLTGAVTLLPDTLYVPPHIAEHLRGRSYRLSVRYGRRYEPWIVGVEP